MEFNSDFRQNTNLIQIWRYDAVKYFSWEIMPEWIFSLHEDVSHMSVAVSFSKIIGAILLQKSTQVKALTEVLKNWNFAFH